MVKNKPNIRVGSIFKELIHVIMEKYERAAPDNMDDDKSNIMLTIILKEGSKLKTVKV